VSARDGRVVSGLAGRLLVALVVVVVTGGLTAWLVAGAIGPAVFHRHMLQAGVGPDAASVLHAEAAFQSASALALGIALAASVVASLVVSVFLTRRIAGSLQTLAGAATRIASGHLDSRVETPRLGSEFDDLSDAFNDMAHQLSAADQLRERLLADVAHEVRTPVAIISAYLEGLEDGVTELTPQTTAVLREQGARLTRLAADLADVTRAEREGIGLAPEELDPADLVDRAAQAARGRLEEAGVTLDVHAEPGLPTVRADPQRLLQVLGNLVDNALRHTPPGKTVTFGATREGDDTVVLTVSDTGEGIAPEHLPHLFERFYRVDTARDREHGGSGIGLAIVRAIVAAHGGTVTAMSEGLGTGTTVEVRLPRVARP
jgi:two-component system sensor histidine kinase BaeS